MKLTREQVIRRVVMENKYAEQQERSLISRLRRYQLTLPMYKKLLERAKHRCEICRGRVRLNIDHNHRTGKVRGVLCGPCNRGLGYFRDRPAYLRAALRFLARR